MWQLLNGSRKSTNKLFILGSYLWKVKVEIQSGTYASGNSKLNLCKWKFKLSGASWWGGQCERMVGLVKTKLYKTVGKSKLEKKYSQIQGQH